MGRVPIGPVDPESAREYLEGLGFASERALRSGGTEASGLEGVFMGVKDWGRGTSRVYVLLDDSEMLGLDGDTHSIHAATAGLVPRVSRVRCSKSRWGGLAGIEPAPGSEE